MLKRTYFTDNTTILNSEALKNIAEIMESYQILESYIKFWILSNLQILSNLNVLSSLGILSNLGNFLSYILSTWNPVHDLPKFASNHPIGPLML